MEEYKAIQGETIEELNATVNEMTQTGQWKPLGGIAISATYTHWENERKGYTEYETIYKYAQAMTRTK